jgi:hypothetical protein
MFAALTFDRDPLRLEDLVGGGLLWLQAAGGFAAMGLLLWFAFGLPRLRKQDLDAVPGWFRVVFVAACLGSVVGYAVYVLVAIDAGVKVPTVDGKNQPLPVEAIRAYEKALTPFRVEAWHAFAGGCALVAVGLPILLGILRLRWRRIFALSKLSFKEAVRRRVLYAFTGLLVVFLFGSWFVPSSAKDEVRTYVEVVFFAMGFLLLFTAAIVSSFSIPADIKQQTIHTIVTKPVERFEIVLGRFLGFLALMSLVLLAMTTISLLYVLSSIHPEAAAESLKARDPLYGELSFENTEDASGKAGTNVGREWDYRSYISKVAPGAPPPTARWDFASVPANLGRRPEVAGEYSFDVYRTTKGDEGRDVYCTFRFYTWRYRKNDDLAFRKKRGSAAIRDRERDDRLAYEYGYFEIEAQPVTDFRTQTFELPAGLFRNAAEDDPEREQSLKEAKQKKIPLTARVLCESPSQYVGMAKYDFYVRLDSGRAERASFAYNFYKGAFGIWMRLALVIGLAVVLSTYLNGVISLLAVGVLYIGGLCREFVETIAWGVNPGGGPTEAAQRIFRRELTSPRADDSTSIGNQLVGDSDVVFRWVIKRVLNLLPDVDRFDFTSYVAEGFNVNGSQLGLDVLLLLAYLIPWAVFAFYLLRWREVAAST